MKTKDSEPSLDSEVPLTVGEVSQLIKQSLELQFRDLWIAGEIQNLTFSAAGHYYFNLHGQDSALSCVLFRQTLAMQQGPDFNLKGLQNGATIWIWGDLSYYQKRGQIQLIGKKVKLGDKEGLLKLKYQQLKQKFETLGYFSVDKKRVIPKTIRKMAIVSGLGTAAIRDFITVYTRRSFHYSIMIAPALVQGDAALFRS